MVGTVQDITERKLAEEELLQYRNHLEELVEQRTSTVKQQARIIDQTHDAIVTTDLEGNITSWNGGAERLFGIPIEKTIGQQLSLIFPSKQRKNVANNILRSIKEEGIYEADLKMLKASETEFTAHASFSLLCNENGKENGIASYILDISEREERESKLKVISNQLQASNQELEAFSYSVSHDLRAPLRGIDGFSLALLEDYNELLDDTGKDYLNRVRKGAQKMSALIDDLLQLSRITRGELTFTSVNLSELARSVVEELQVAEPNREIDIVIEPGLYAHGDTTMLEVLLANLIGNSWKFTRNKPHALIEFGYTPNDKNITYYIRDNGAGFDMKYAKKLFSAFQRLHNQDQFEGTGVGLATVQRIINRHGGKIWAKSEVNLGATFYFSLPSSINESFKETNKSKTIESNVA